MTIRRASVILPCHSWDDFPTYLGDQAAAELLAAWTALWHPAIIAATGRLPGWHQADEPPDPASLEGELVLVPPPSRVRMPSDWCDRLRATAPNNPPPVETSDSRPETIVAMLGAASVEPNEVDVSSAGDFLALGFADLQVELLTRAMRYSSVLDTEHFEAAVVAGARAATSGNQPAARDELNRAFDLLADARNHVYSVDFYVVDITLVSESTSGETLRSKLAARQPTNLLITGQQLDRLADTHPETLAELKQAIAAGTVTIVGGMQQAAPFGPESPESLLANLVRGQDSARRHLDREFEIFGQYDAAFSSLLPEVLKGLGFRGALHAAFDGNPLSRADQRKTNWGANPATSIEALSATPLDAGRAETWLKFAERVGDSIAHDHVATLVLAGWPGAECDYFGDLRRVTGFGTVLGKLVTLDEYFPVSREPDDWTTFFPREYRRQVANAANAISSQVDAYRSDVRHAYSRLCAGFAEIASFKLMDERSETLDEIVNPLCSTERDGTFTNSTAPEMVAINPWNFACSRYVGFDPVAFDDDMPGDASRTAAGLRANVLACGYASAGSVAIGSPVELAEGLVLRNEQVELTVSEKTGGIQSLRTHRDRSTRVSQRLVYHHDSGAYGVESQMIADRVEISRNDSLVGQIASTGRLLDANDKLLARFTQRLRVVRGLAPVIVDVELDPQQLPAGDTWKSYFASRLAWAGDALDIRRGEQWSARKTQKERIESPEWVEIDDAIGKVTCFALGLPYHRRPAANWLDTLLLVDGEERRRFQFAIGLDQALPTRTALATLTAGETCLARLPGAPQSARGWFLHIGATNALLTHVAALPAPSRGIRLRLLETEGRETSTVVSAFRPFTAARITDFRGNAIEVLSVVDGAAEIDMGPYRWIQIEAEW
jgi:alpha-mannosidase